LLCSSPRAVTRRTFPLRSSRTSWTPCRCTRCGGRFSPCRRPTRSRAHSSSGRTRAPRSTSRSTSTRSIPLHCFPRERSTWARCPGCSDPRSCSTRSRSRRPEAIRSTSRSRSIRGRWCSCARGRPCARSGRPCRSMPSCGSSAWTPRRAVCGSRSWSIRIAGTAASSPDSPSSSAVIDLKLLRASPQQVRAALARRGDPTVTRLLDELEALDMRRRALTGQLDQLKAERNEAVKADARLMKEKGALPPDVRESRRALGERIDRLEAELKGIEEALDEKLLYVPNLPLPDVPDGDASHNKIVRTWGEPAPKGGKPHWEIGEQLGLLDLARGAKISGSGFPVFVGPGSKPVRAPINFMLDQHTREHGYVEVEPPFVVKRATMQGTGQVPKFADDAYKTAPDDLFLVPTAEVPVTNLHRDEILDGGKLPLCYTAYTPCFRREAGAAGRDTRGLLRVHQFDKVELVRFARPPESPAEHERMTGHAEAVLQRLELPYRVVLLAAGDLGFASAKTYDLEVWSPGVGQWLEVSSSSTFTDFQARRANIRYRASSGAKPELAHTLNASGVALPRTIAALLETRQQPDGSVTVPAALVPYLGMERLVPSSADGA